MIIVFYEKHGNRYVEGQNLKEIMDWILYQRIQDAEIKRSKESLWYGNQTAKAIMALESGQSILWMKSRKQFDYEGWEEIFIEKSQPVDEDLQSCF